MEKCCPLLPPPPSLTNTKLGLRTGGVFVKTAISASERGVFVKTADFGLRTGAFVRHAAPNQAKMGLMSASEQGGVCETLPGNTHIFPLRWCLRTGGVCMCSLFSLKGVSERGVFVRHSRSLDKGGEGSYHFFGYLDISGFVRCKF